MSISQNNLSQASVEIPRPDLGILAGQLLKIKQSRQSLDIKRNELLQMVVGLVNAAGVIFFQRDTEQLEARAEIVSRQAENWAENIVSECRESAEVAVKNGKASITVLKPVPAVRVISCPVPGNDKRPQSCLCALILLGETPAEPFLIILQLLAASLADLKEITSFTGQSPSLNSALLELFSLPAEQREPAQVADFLRSWSGCSLVAVGTRSEKGGLALQHITDLLQVDIRTEQARLYLNVIEECLSKEQTVHWSGSIESKDTELSLVMKELLRDTKMNHGLAVPLSGDGKRATVLILLYQTIRDESYMFVELSHINQLFGPVFFKLYRGVKEKNRSAGSRHSVLKRTVALVGLAAIFAMIAWFPMNYKLDQKCWIEPLHLRYVVARFDGLLKDVYVELGASVKVNQELATLDGREIELELASLDADIAKADKVYDSYVASGEVAKAQMSKLEYERLQVRTIFLRDRLDKLSLTSPLDGVVLSSDIQKQKGGPVTRGQVLFEIAPVETVVLELGIEDADISHVREGMVIDARFEAFPDRIWQGEVEQISPKSSFIQGRNLFVASLHLDNSDGLLQPGMHGQAVVTSDRKRFAWIYFHKPWYALKRAIFSMF